MTDTNFIAVLQSPVPVVVMMWRAGCPGCKALFPTLVEAARELPGMQFKPLNSDANTDVRDHYHVDVVPTLLLFENGELVRRFSGAAPKETIVAWIQGKAVAEPGKVDCDFCRTIRSYLPKFARNFLEKWAA